jgi:hypothetical protein
MKPNFNIPDYRLTPGMSRRIKIVNHHSDLLNNKCGVVIGKDIPSYYNWRVWLDKDQVIVIVHQANIIPAEEQAFSFADVFSIHWKIAVHNLAVKIQAGLRR